MLNGQKKKKEQKKKKAKNSNFSKFQSFKFHYSLNNFGRDPPHEYAWILGGKSDVFFQRRCRLILLLPYVISYIISYHISYHIIAYHISVFQAS